MAAFLATIVLILTRCASTCKLNSLMNLIHLANGIILPSTWLETCISNISVLQPLLSFNILTCTSSPVASLLPNASNSISLNQWLVKGFLGFHTFGRLSCVFGLKLIQISSKSLYNLCCTTCPLKLLTLIMKFMSVDCLQKDLKNVIHMFFCQP